MKYQLKNLGRNKVNAIVSAKTQNALFRKVKTYLLSEDVTMEGNQDNTGWNVFAGMRHVGEVLDCKEGE